MAIKTYQIKVGNKEINAKMAKALKTKVWSQLNAPLKVANSWREINGVFGKDERTHELTALFGGGEGVIEDPEEHAKDCACLLNSLPDLLTKANYQKFVDMANEIYYKHLPIVDKRLTEEQEAGRIAESKRIMEEQRKEYEAKPKRDHRDIAEIAKEVRANLKAEFPACKFSVTIERYSMGRSLTVALMEAPFPVLEDTHHWSKGHAQLNEYTLKNEYTDGKNNGAILTREAWDVLAKASKIGNATNWDDSDMMTDYYSVNYSFSIYVGKWDKAFTQTETHQTEKLATPKHQENSHYIEWDRDWTWVFFDDKPSEETRTALKSNGGRWSRKRKGWYFREVLTAEAVANMLGSNPQPSAATKPETNSAPKADPIQAKFRKMADALTDKIEEKRQPMTQNSTPKRESQHRSKLADADHLERTQRALNTIADAREAGTLPEALTGLKSKKDVHELLFTRWENHGYYDNIDTGEYSVSTPEALALHELMGAESEETKARRDNAEMESQIRNLTGEIDGFFPTPKNVIDELILGLPEGADVLEPSAGAGHICDALKERNAKITAIEWNHTLSGILEQKGYTVAGDDFLEYEGKHDYIIMNPPFEKGQDMKHIQHAYSCLNEGGFIASVTSAGILNGRGEKFREWLDDVGGDYYDLPEGSFKESGTNVNTCVVKIHK